jgi:hypothetical protein
MFPGLVRIMWAFALPGDLPAEFLEGMDDLARTENRNKGH